jgi:hypothetical protein
MQRARGNLIITLGAILASGCCAASALAQSRPDPFEAAVRRLSDAVRPHRDGRHLELLASLRSLEDPALAPLFSRLTSSEDPAIQINGILGLAETSTERRIDPWLLSRLPSPAAQLQALNLAIGLELIDAPQMRTILESNDLDDAVRIALLAELISKGESIDASALSPLAASENQKVRAIAAMLLSQLTGEPSHFEAFLKEVEGLTGEEQRYAFLWLANDAGQYRLTAMLPWLESIGAAARGNDDELAAVAIESALLIDPARGAVMWRDHLAIDPSHGRRVAFGLILLDAAREVAIPAALFDEIRDGGELTERMADAGAMLAGDRMEGAPPLIALLSLDHWRSAADAAAAAKLLPPQDAADVYEAIIHRSFETSADVSVRGPREELAALAVPLLFEIAPSRIETILSAAPDDSREQEIILVGLLASNDARAGETARGIKRLGFGAADCLALLLIAKHAASPGGLEAAESRNLGILAAGGGRLSAGMAAEAAWLYIKHAGRVELAMSRLFAPEAGSEQ